MERDLCLVLSGGAFKGVGILGAVQCVYEMYTADRVSHFIGTSVGAIIGYLLCIGMSPLEIVHAFVESDIARVLSTEVKMEKIWSNSALLEFEHILEVLELLTLRKHGRLFTLEDLWVELGKDLGCVTYNYSRQHTMLLHHTTTPTLSCLTAIRMSSSIPYVFDKCVHEGDIYLDGAVTDNFPMRFALKLGLTNIIGIAVNAPKTLPQELSAALIAILPIMENTKRTIRKYRRRFPVVDVALSEMGLEFSMDLAQIMEMFSCGYRACRKKFRLDSLDSLDTSAPAPMDDQ
jgi:predicted acylesterase/phospholipase RssA